VDLKIASFSADSSNFTITLTNEGADASGKFTVYYVMDEIYLADPDYTYATISDIPGRQSTSFAIPNQLTSSDGKGGHCVTAYADYNSEVEETNEGNNKKYAYYYDGSYSSAYSNINSKYSTWKETLRSKVQSDYGWSASGSYNTHLVDTITSESGSSSAGLMSRRMLYGSSTSTPVVLLNLKSASDGYSNYGYQDSWHTYNSSQEVIYHEYTHAFHYEHVKKTGGSSVWSDLADWFIEGLAVYTAGQGEDRVKYYAYTLKKNSGYTESQALEEILEAVDGASTVDSNDYAGNFLAIDYIVNTFGLAALKNIINDSAAGTSLNTAIVNNLSNVSSITSFRSKVRTYATTYLDTYWAGLDTPTAAAVSSPRVFLDERD